jgi:hypothetical protein
MYHVKNMSFSKSAMQDELRQFLDFYGTTVENLYGVDRGSWINDQTIKNSPIWEASNEMYDYGIKGIPTGDLIPGSQIDGKHAYAEKFFRGISVPAMQIYLGSVQRPRLAMKAAQCAVARMVLDGGDRFTDFELEDYGFGGSGYLTLQEIALLANMDEKSVRNAANPKLPCNLKTEQVGKRSLVLPEEAKRWLGGRKGFVKTRETNKKPIRPNIEFNFEITKEIAEAIMKKAEEESRRSGVPLSICWQNLILSANK